MRLERAFSLENDESFYFGHKPPLSPCRNCGWVPLETLSAVDEKFE